MNQRRQNGVTIVEVLVVILILSLSITTLASVMSSGLVAIRHNGGDLLARLACRRRMEFIRTQSFQTIANHISDNPAWPFTEGLENLPGAIGRTYVCNQLATDARSCDTNPSFPGSTNILRVTVLVQADLNQTSMRVPAFELIPSAYASGPSLPPRGVWRLVTWVTKCGMNELCT